MNSSASWLAKSLETEVPQKVRADDDDSYQGQGYITIILTFNELNRIANNHCHQNHSHQHQSADHQHF